MKTIIDKITSDRDNNIKIIHKAAGIIRDGGLVAFPTETVYGLGGNAFDKAAASKIYEAKGRPSDNPLIVHISEIEDLEQVGEEVPDKAYILAKRFWPGPLTIIIKKNDRVPLSVTGGLDTVAVRLPSHPVARELIAESGTFIAAPSANLSGRPSPTSGEHVIEDLNGRIDMIIDGGFIDIGLESTIVDLSEDIPVVLRPGYITISMLEEAVGEVRMDPAMMTGVKDGVQPKAPGMKYRHYAPKAELTLIEGRKSLVLRKMSELLEKGIKSGLKVGIMTTAENTRYFKAGEVISLGSSTDGEEIARHLFAALRKFDELNVDVIYSEAFSEEGIGQAVMNRLQKAAGYRIVHV
ncbi:MAG: L-threonylcarbamoyladenylate synthase [Butyrivibrio sp.]